MSVRSVVVRCALILALLAVVGGGCFGGGSATPSGELRIEVGSGQSRCEGGSSPCAQVAQITRSYSLTCNPTGGTMPNPEAACAAIDDLTTHHRAGQPCRIVLPQGPTVQALVRGTFAGKPVRLWLFPSSWCGEPAPVMKDYWILSTFPCSTVVVHFDNGDHVYSEWAHKSGCTDTGSTISLSRVG
jgi:hypothetical protein